MPSNSRHLLSELDIKARTALCGVCGPVKMVKTGTQHGLGWRCRQKSDLYAAQWRNDNREHYNEYAREKARLRPPLSPEVRQQKARLWNYGLSQADFDALLEKQHGVCCICQEVPEKWNVDHDHATGEVRGLLCPPCNKGLAFFRDDPERMAHAIAYLVKEEVDSK